MKKKVKVKVLKIAGETGLRMPGSFLQMDNDKANALIHKGVVELVVKPKKVKKSK